MIPFRRVFDEKRRLVIPVAGGLVLNLVLYAGIVYPVSVRVRSTEQRERTAQGELLNAEQEDKAARDLVQGKDRTDVALQTFYRDVLPENLAGANGMTYLHLARLAGQHNLKSSRRTFAPEPNPHGSLDRLRLTMALEGNYDDVRRFIYELEAGSPFIVIDGVTLAQPGEPGSPLQLTLALSTFYRHGA